MDENKAYTLRKLTADDLFPMFQIVSKIGIKEFKNCFDNPEMIKAFKQEGNFNVEALGINIAFDMAGVLMANLPVAKDSIYSFLAGVSNVRCISDCAVNVREPYQGCGVKNTAGNGC